MAKIEFDREACIGCMACTTVSSNWVEDNGKVKPLKKQVSGKEVQENKEAAAMCPVQAIKVLE